MSHLDVDRSLAGQEAEKDGEDGRGGWWIAVAATSLLLLSVHLYLVRGRSAPVLYHDEMGYLAAARFLAGDGAVPRLGPTSYYFPGYAIAIAPVMRLVADPGAAYRGALWLNSALGAAHLLPLVAVCRHVLRLDRWVALAVAATVAAYPAYLLQSGFAWSETLLVLLTTTFAFLAYRTVSRGRVRDALALSAVGGFAYTTHPRMLGVALLAPVLLGILGARGKVSTLGAWLGAGTTAAILVVTSWLNARLLDRLYVRGTTGREVGGVLDRVADPSEWGSILVHAAGQAWYLAAATLGLAPLGLAALVVLTRRRRHDGPAAWRRRHDGPAAWPRRHDGPTAWPLDPPRTTAAIVVAGFLSVFAASTIFLSAGERIDILIYGRYNEAALPVVLAAGIAFLLTRGATVRSLGAVAVLLIVLADVTLLANDPAAFADPRKPTVNALGVLPFDLSPGGLDVLRITALTVIAAVALWLAVRLRPTVAVLLLGAWFLGAAIAVQRHVLIDYAAYWTRAVSLRDVIPATGADVVAYDTAHFSETLHGYQYWLGSVDLVRYDSAREHPPADLLLSSKQPAGLPTGSRLVATERAIDQALWALPGELQQRLEARGYLAPPGNAALPRTALRSHLDLHGPPPGSLQPGGSVRLTVRAFHDGAGSPWLPSRDPDSNDGAVGIGARWFPNDDPSTPVAVQRSYLTRTVLPGQAHEVVVELAARDDDEPLPPGRYRVAISLFEDGGVWFDEQRGGRLALTIDVV